MVTITKHQRWFYLNIVFTVLILLSVVWLVQALDLNSTAGIERWAEQSHNMLLVLSVLVMLMIVAAMTPFPAEAVTLANGMIFGPEWGVMITWSSAMFGAYITFIWSRYFSRHLKNKYADNEKMQKADQWMRKWGIPGFLLARLVPAVPFFALNIGAAFLPISSRAYLLITGLAILPHVVIICYFGGYLMQG
jgi:uncharacterized membrane protein YdjX (TVP38/TMEM64 family)